MQLEIGKCYFDRDGHRWGPIVAQDWDEYPFGVSDEAWAADGRYTARCQHSRDLIAEAAPALEPKDGLPVWRCHKEVWAAKVVFVRDHGPGKRLELDVDGGGETVLTIVASLALQSRLPTDDPIDALGGYYVRYADGYESWSPAKAFEEGYTLRT